MPQNIDRHLFGSSTAPRGVRIVSVIFSLFSVAALVIFIISILRNIDGPPLVIKVVRIGLPIIVLAGAYMIRRLRRAGLWMFGVGVGLWFFILSRSLLVVDQGVPSLILVGILWCFSLGTLIYLIVMRNVFGKSALLPMVPQNTLPAEAHAALPVVSQDIAHRDETKENPPPRIL